MNPVSIKTKLLSLFVLTFLCLNAGGAVCLAYCQAGQSHKIETAEHCPLPANTAHCPHHAERPAEPAENTDSASSNAVQCCTLAINLFAAPLEQKQVSQEIVLVPVLEAVSDAPVFLFAIPNQPRPINFRQPSLDRRVERIKNSVFRI